MEIYNNLHQRQRMRLLFRQLQITYKTINEVLAKSSEIGWSAAFLNVYIAFGLYFFIRTINQHEGVFFTVQGTIVIACCLLVKSVLDAIHNITLDSQIYADSYHKNVARNSKYEILFLNSCKPFEWNIGGIIKVDHQTFVWVMTTYTIDNLITLLQAF